MCINHTFNLFIHCRTFSMSTSWFLGIILQWTWENRYLSENLFIFFGQITRDEIAGSYGRSIFNFFMNLYVVLHCAYTISFSKEHCTRIPVSPQPTLFVFFYLIKRQASWRVSCNISLCYFDLHFPGLFIYLLAGWLLWKNVYLCFFSPIFNGLYFCYCVVGSYYMFQY